MFNSQHWKIKLVYIGFGSFFGCLCTIIGMLASPVTAQRDKFGDIECTRLSVVDTTGKFRVVLSGDGSSGFVGVVGDGGLVNLHAGLFSAQVSVEAKGGSISVADKDGKSSASLSLTDYGGRVQVNGKGEGTAVVGINEYGNGAVSTWDKNGYRQ